MHRLRGQGPHGDGLVAAAAHGGRDEPGALRPEALLQRASRQRGHLPGCAAAQLGQLCAQLAAEVAQLLQRQVRH